MSLYLTGTGMPPPEKHRYYICELKWNTWECKRQEKPDSPYEKSVDALASQVVPVRKEIPSFFDQLLLAQSLRKPVAIKPPTS